MLWGEGIPLWQLPERLSSSPSSDCFLHLTPSHPSSRPSCTARCPLGLLTPSFCPIPPLLQWTNCVKVVSQDKTTFPNLKDVREVVTDQFLCSGMQGDDNPCKGEPPTHFSPPVPTLESGLLRGRPPVSLWPACMPGHRCTALMQ